MSGLRSGSPTRTGWRCRGGEPGRLALPRARARPRAARTATRVPFGPRIATR
jgi:hypothetical protein